MADRSLTEKAVAPARLHHHAFVTSDQEATRQFYEDVVGVPLVATWTEVEHLMGGEEQEFCHTMYELGDGGCLAFFQFANDQFSEQFARPPPFSLFRHFAMLVTSEQQAAIRSSGRGRGSRSDDDRRPRLLQVALPHRPERPRARIHRRPSRRPEDRCHPAGERTPRSRPVAVGRPREQQRLASDLVTRASDRSSRNGRE